MYYYCIRILFLLNLNVPNSQVYTILIKCIKLDMCFSV